MKITFDKSFGRTLLVSIFKKQSTKCEYCNKKITEKNLGMVANTSDGVKARCNGLMCLLQYIHEKDSE